MKTILVRMFLLTFCLPGAALADRQNEPAIKSEHAIHSFLFDAETRHGLQVIAGERGHILYRERSSEPWLQSSVPVRVNLTAVSLGDPAKLWATGHDGIVLSSSDAKVWQVALSGETLVNLANLTVEERLSLLERQDPNSDLIYDLQFIRDEIAYSSKDGGAASLFDIHMQASGIGIIVGALGWAFKTEDHGVNWTFITPDLPNPGLLHLYSTTATPAGMMFIAGEGGLLFRSVNGEEWESVSLPYDGTILKVHATDRNGELYLLGMGGKILHSLDDGNSWSLIQLETSSVLQGICTLSDGGAIVTGLGGQVYYVERNSQKNIPFAGRQHLSAPVCTDRNFHVVGQGGIYPLAVPSAFMH